MRCGRSQSHLISTRRPTAAPLRLSLFPSFLANPPDLIKQLSPPPVSFFHLRRTAHRFLPWARGKQATAGARTSSSSLPAIPMLLLWLVSFNLGGNVLLCCEAQKTWCVAKPSTDEATLQQNIDFACSQVDCSAALRSGSPCSNPGTRINHASVAMNLYYQSKGRNVWNCHFKASGLIVQTDPSYGNCVYM